MREDKEMRFEKYLLSENLKKDDLNKLRSSFMEVGIKSGVVPDAKGFIVISKNNKTPESTIFMAIDKAGFEVTGETKDGYRIKKYEI